jgi:hypothetical protein
MLQLVFLTEVDITTEPSLSGCGEKESHQTLQPLALPAIHSWRNHCSRSEAKLQVEQQSFQTWPATSAYMFHTLHWHRLNLVKVYLNLVAVVSPSM